MSDVTIAATTDRSPRRKGAVRRQQIIDMARRTLIESGVAGLILRDVAEKIGITHGNLQYYFATKDDLILAVFDQEIHLYTDSMHDAVERTSTRYGRISAIIDSAVNVIKGESTPLWTMLCSLARQSEELRSILQTAYKQFDASLAEELGQIDPSLSAMRRLHIAQMIRMIIDGFGIQTAFDDPNGANMVALQGEIKTAIMSWFDIEQTG